MGQAFYNLQELLDAIRCDPPETNYYSNLFCFYALSEYDGGAGHFFAYFSTDLPSSRPYHFLVNFRYKVDPNELTVAVNGENIATHNILFAHFYHNLYLDHTDDPNVPAWLGRCRWGYVNEGETYQNNVPTTMVKQIQLGQAEVLFCSTYLKDPGSESLRTYVKRYTNLYGTDEWEEAKRRFAQHLYDGTCITESEFYDRTYCTGFITWNTILFDATTEMTNALNWIKNNYYIRTSPMFSGCFDSSSGIIISNKYPEFRVLFKQWADTVVNCFCTLIFPLKRYYEQIDMNDHFNIYIDSTNFEKIRPFLAQIDISEEAVGTTIYNNFRYHDMISGYFSLIIYYFKNVSLCEQISRAYQSMEHYDSSYDNVPYESVSRGFLTGTIYRAQKYADLNAKGIPADFIDSLRKGFNDFWGKHLYERILNNVSRHYTLYRNYEIDGIRYPITYMGVDLILKGLKDMYTYFYPHFILEEDIDSIQCILSEEKKTISSLF